MGVNSGISEKIKQYRTAMGMTQEEFASEIGVAALHISCIERGTKGISLEKLIEVCKKLQISMDDLVPVVEFDDSLKEKWIGEIVECLRGMSTVQIGILKRMISSMDG